MQLLVQRGRYSTTPDGNILVMLECPRQNMAGFDEVLQGDDIKTFELSKRKKHRSLDANGALWLLCTKIAETLNTSKESVYHQMLVRYGVYEHMVVTEKAYQRLLDKSPFKVLVKVDEIKINDKTSIHVQGYYGSSSYDSKEFSVLLDGVINEASDLGIEFISMEDKLRMIEEWGK